MVDSATELGREVGRSMQSQNRIQQNMSPDESDAQLNIVNSDELVFNGVFTAKKRVLTNVLTVGHVVYGVVGPSGYPVYVPLILGHPIWGVLGKGYLPVGSITFPAIFPWSFSGSNYSSTVIYTVNF